MLADFAKSGFVTIRVEKPGVGDSEGGPFADAFVTGTGAAGKAQPGVHHVRGKCFDTWASPREPVLPEATISEQGGVRYLHLDTPWIQGAMRIARPYALEVEYTRGIVRVGAAKPATAQSN